MSESIPINLQSCSLDEDARLVVAAQQNPAEFRQLYSKWLKPVYRYFYFRVGNVEDAEDLTAQVFLKAYETLPRYRNRGSFSGWLFTIAHARAVDYYRKGRREVTLEDSDYPENSLDLLSQAAHSDDVQQVLALIRGLPEKDQELIRLRFMADLSYREIGQVLKRNEDAVRKSISRLLNRIQSQLEFKND